MTLRIATSQTRPAVKLAAVRRASLPLTTTVTTTSSASTSSTAKSTRPHDLADTLADSGCVSTSTAVKMAASSRNTADAQHVSTTMARWPGSPHVTRDASHAGTPTCASMNESDAPGAAPDASRRWRALTPTPVYAAPCGIVSSHSPRGLTSSEKSGMKKMPDEALPIRRSSRMAHMGATLPLSNLRPIQNVSTRNMAVQPKASASMTK